MYEAAILPLDEKKYNVLAVEEIGKKMGVHVLRLPPYNCDMNPIEMAWSVTKGKAMKSFRNGERTVVSVEKVLSRKPYLIDGNFPRSRTSWIRCLLRLHGIRWSM